MRKFPFPRIHGPCDDLCIRSISGSFRPDPQGCDRVKVVVSFLKLNFLQTAGATGVVESIKESFKVVSIDDLFHELVGFETGEN